MNDFELRLKVEVLSYLADILQRFYRYLLIFSHFLHFLTKKFAGFKKYADICTVKRDAMQCTLYKQTIRSKKITTSILDLNELMTRFQHDEKKRQAVEAFRQQLKDLPPFLRPHHSEQLPRICPGWVVRRRRDGSKATGYTGIVLLEFNEIERQEELNQMKTQAATWPTTLAVFEGAEGKCLHILIRGTFEDGSLPNETEAAEHFHAELYRKCVSVYASVLGMVPRAKEARTDDTFLWTYDPTAYFDGEAAAVKVSREAVWHGRNRSYALQQQTLQLQAFLQSHYELRFNVLTNGVEWKRNDAGSHTFQPLDARMMNTMILECHESGLDVRDRDLKRYLSSTRIRDYNVARTYLHQLPRTWDGRTDYIGALADRVPCRNPRWRVWFHTWFLGMVRQWIDGTTNQGTGVMPLLIGSPDSGMSVFCQQLLPPELQQEGYGTLLIHLDGVDRISEKMRQMLIKKLTHGTATRGRRPYSSVAQEMPRYASLIATANNTDILSDATYARRFIVADIRDGLNIKNEQKTNYKDIFNQALTELEQGQRYDFTAEELQEMETYNMSHHTMRPEVSHFLDIFEPMPEADEGTRKMKLSDIAKVIKLRSDYDYSDKAFNYLGRWLTGEARAGRLRRTMSNGCPHYLVRMLK